MMILLLFEMIDPLFPVHCAGTHLQMPARIIPQACFCFNSISPNHRVCGVLGPAKMVASQGFGAAGAVGPVAG